MRPARSLGSAITVALVFALTSCGDGPASPISTSAAERPGKSGASNVVQVVQRATRLASAEVVHTVVGSDGGVISLDAGLTLTIPPGALSKDTRITVTAPAGDLVGYRFAPHGLHFALPVRATQTIDGTEITSLSTHPFVTYFQGALGATVSELERLEVTLSRDSGLASFEIRHFSGYVIATD